MEDIKTRINFKKLDIEDHAVQRAIERFNRKDRSDALNFCKSLLGNSRYIGQTTCERGNQAHMFVSPNKIEIYLTIDLGQIKTLMSVKEKKHIVYDKIKNEESNVEGCPENIFSNVEEIPLQDKLIKLYQREFKKYDRQEKKLNKEFTEFRFIKSIEIAELNYRIYKCKSLKLRNSLSETLRAIEQTLAEMVLGLKKVQDDKRKIAKALSSLLTVSN
ncbi:hypothetical protein NBRC13296_12360 [Paenibacillus chitinolyticus]|uniref:hypothetical protein n=1 Tax=Paenibacillus chitinolyticus TaxID=79263 RepID=UPI003555E155